MSRRIKRTVSRDEHPKRERRNGPRREDARPKSERAPGHRPGQKPGRFAEERSEYRQEKRGGHEKPQARPDESKAKAELPLPTKVQTVVVTPDEDNMRVDRFLEARFPGLSFSHIQRIVRKGELRVNGRRADSKDRLEAGQSVRIPPLRLDTPKTAGALSDAE